jgi:RHS repeat-associated protein
MGASLGRDTTPDAPFADQDSRDPQSWNLYTYVRNNPLLYVDPDGRAATVDIETDEGGCPEYR